MLARAKQGGRQGEGVVGLEGAGEGLAEEVDAIGASSLAAGHKTLIPELIGLLREAGRPAEAIAALRDLLKDAQPSDATRELQLTLAEMLAASGTPGTEAATLVDTILAGDPGQGAALKLRARMALAGMGMTPEMIAAGSAPFQLLNAR